MPWFVTLIIGLVFVSAGVIQWGFENTIEKRSHPEETHYFYDKDGNTQFQSFHPGFFKEYKIVKKKAAK